MDAQQHRRSLEFPLPLLEGLDAALAHYVARRTESELEGVHRALHHLCTEAHQRGLGPERMVITLKEAWAALPESQQTRNSREADALRALFERVLSACLDSYFAARENGESTAI